MAESGCAQIYTRTPSINLSEDN